MTKPKPTTPSSPPSRAAKTPANEKPLGAKDHYQREKARRARHTPVNSEAMESAKREYEALLEANAVKGRGGRPKKTAKKAEDVADEDGADAE